jgi:pimeloyl-ACP methyl ester carboxylesterase
LGIILSVPLLVALALTLLYFHLVKRYMGFLVRAFQEKPLFITPRGEPVPDAEEISVRTSDGLDLRGCYLRSQQPRRSGVILFGLEFGSSRWGCAPYCQFLVDKGFDVCAVEFRGQGDSDAQPGYEPRQWVTNYELQDIQAALAYLKGRPDSDPNGVGFFGISKGGSAGVMAAAEDPYVRCCVTDGIFSTRSTMIPYMRKWVSIISTRYWLQRILPEWYYGLFADDGLRRIQEANQCTFPELERALPRLAPRPLLMIHGAADTYIKPAMARALFGKARQPKEFWLVEDAKHNQALQVAGDAYRQRVHAFFKVHLAPVPSDDQPPSEGLKRLPAGSLLRTDHREVSAGPRPTSDRRVQI